MKTSVDLLMKGGGGQGELAAYMQGQGRLDPGSLRPYITDKGAFVAVYKGNGDPNDKKNYYTVPVTNATLRRDEWKQLDDALLKVARERLGGIDDLVSNGLTYPLGNAMGTTVLEWHDVNDAFEADITMDGITRSVGDRPTFQFNYLPIPIIHVDYEINARVLEASRKLGNSLDTISAEMAARRVREKLEDMLFTNTTYSYGETDDRNRNTIYGYLNHPDRNQVTMDVDWNDSSTTAAKILADVIAMKQASIDARHHGPWMLYIPDEYETVLDKDYDTRTPGTTIRDRILKISGIKDIKVIDRLTIDNVLLVQMTSDVVRLITGLPLQNVQWKEEGQFVTKYKVLTIQVPQIRSDRDGRCGVTHLA